jgi:hypothetical protein
VPQKKKKKKPTGFLDENRGMMVSWMPKWRKSEPVGRSPEPRSLRTAQVDSPSLFYRHIHRGSNLLHDRQLFMNFNKWNHNTHTHTHTHTHTQANE